MNISQYNFLWRKPFAFLKNIFDGILSWLEEIVPRWQPAAQVLIAVVFVSGIIIYGSSRIFAATYLFNQTDWSDGSISSNITHPTNQTSWTKYYSQTGADTTSTPGSIKISSTVGQLTEAFTNSTYKDVANTTAAWDVTARMISKPVVISGTLYETDETTAIATSPTVKMKIGSQTATTTVAAANGTFSFTLPYNLHPVSGDIITIWIDGAAEDGSLVFRYGSSCTGDNDCTGLAVNRNQVIFSSYDGSALTNTALAACSNTIGTGCTDTEIGFSSNATTGVLALSSGRTFRMKDSSALFTQNGSTATITADYFKMSAGTFTGASQAIAFSTYTQTGGTFISTSGTLTVYSTWTSSSGSPVFTHNSGTVKFIPSWDAAQTITPGSIQFNTVYFTASYGTEHNVTGTMTILDDFFVDSTYTANSGSVIGGGGVIAVGGDFTLVNNTGYFNGGTYNSGNATIQLNGSGDQTITGSGGYKITPSVQINKSTGAVNLVGTIYLGKNWTWTSGPTLNAGSSTLHIYEHYGQTNAITPGSGSYNNVTISGGGDAYSGVTMATVSGTMDINGNLIIDQRGYGGQQVNSGAMTVAGNISITNSGSAYGSLAPIGGTTNITLDGTGTQNISVASGGKIPGTFTINKASGTATLISNTTLYGALAVTQGTFDQGASYNLVTGGAVTVGASGIWTNTGTGDITLAGNVTNSGTVTLNGNAASCGEADDITITTSSVPTTRSWSGSGTYSLWDLNVLYQTGSRTAYSSTQGTGATWTFAGSGCTTGMIEGPYLGKGPSIFARLINDVRIAREVLDHRLVLLTHNTKAFAYKVNSDFTEKINTYINLAYESVNGINAFIMNDARVIVTKRFNEFNTALADMFTLRRAIAATNATAQSLNLSSGVSYVTTATLTATATLGTGTATYYLSNDGGSSFNEVTSGQAYVFSSNGNGDLRWKTVLTGNAIVTGIVVDYNYYGNVNLISNPYDATDATNIVTKVAWTSAGITATSLAKVQIRTSADNSTWSGWCGYADTSTCDGTNYFTEDQMFAGSIDIPSNNPTRNGGDDRWFQYKVTLIPGTEITASVTGIDITYVVNAPPEFNATDGLVVSQVSDSSSTNWGKVSIAYSIRDSDTSTGSATPGYITPSFQYNIGGSWTSISSGDLSTNALANKSVDGTSYTTYTAYWTATSTVPTNYLTTAQVKVTINDNEGANNTATQTSSNFTLDTTNPAVSAATYNSSTDVLTLSATDNTNLQYIISNNSDLSADGVNATSGQWQTVGANSVSVTPAWTPTGSPSYETMYLKVVDLYGNLATSTIVAPYAPTSGNIQDISNVPINVFKEFLSWAAYTPTTGSAFGSYKVYRSTDGSSYSLASTIADVNSNSYFDTSVTASSTYYYKIAVVDSDGDTSAYSSVLTDKVDGQGGTDIAAPNISAVTVSESQVNYVTITWTTDEISNSTVDYSVSPSTAFGSTATSASYVTSHSVTVTGLTPGTTYLFRVKSTDILGNVATANNSGAGYTFTATGGTTISDVTKISVNDTTATITWNTSTDSDSYVTYSANADMVTSSRTGSASLVGSPYEHRVTITGLTPGTRYYYFVESTDASANYAKDNNSGSYYTFTTITDTKAPVISAVSVPVTGREAAVVVWTTDEPATTKVEYGSNSTVYSNSTDLDSTLTTFHTASISGLTNNSQYYYRVRSADSAGNITYSGESDFTTNSNQFVVSFIYGGADVPDKTAPKISNIKIKDIKPFGATVTFETDEDCLAFIDYGGDSSKLDHTYGKLTYSRNIEMKLDGLQMGKDYVFKIKAVDKSGNTTTSDQQTFTTTFLTESGIQIKDAATFQKEIQDAIESALPSLVPPFVSTPKVTEVTDTSAKITWRTNVKSYGSVGYVDDKEYDAKAINPYPNEAADTLNKTIDHEINLVNLKPDTKYHVMARGFSIPGVTGSSADITFLTEAPSIQATIGSVGNDSFRATWFTAEPTTSVVEYKNLKTGELNQKSSDSKVSSHDIKVDNLTPGTSYSVSVYGYNEKGNKVSITESIRITTSIDTTAPVISSLKIDSALIAGRTDRSQTIISWKTDEPSNSTVYFKEGVAGPNEELTNKVEMLNNLVIDHAVVVSSLKPGGLYSIQISSTDAAGNTTLFPVRTVVVPQQTQSVVEIIFKNFEDTFQFLKR